MPQEEALIEQQQMLIVILRARIEQLETGVAPDVESLLEEARRVGGTDIDFQRFVWRLLRTASKGVN